MALPAALLATLVIVGLVIVRALWIRVGGSGSELRAAVSLLEERYARGEIDHDEYTTRRRQPVEPQG